LRSHYRALSVNDLFAFIAARDRDAILLTGDSSLRRLAENEGVMVHGTLWLLGELVRLSIVLPAKAICILERMLDTGSRFPDAECERRSNLWAQCGMPGDYRESDG
jgi:predicted nucleic acid-binding protein